MADFVITLPPRLAALLKACETYCVVDCCGIDAFEFSPLNIASHLSAYRGEIPPQDIESLYKELDRVLALGTASPPNADGFVCTIEGTNSYFTRETLAALVARIKWASGVAPRMLEYSATLEKEAPAWPLYLSNNRPIT